MNDKQYNILKHTAGYRSIHKPGYIRIRGESPVDFLNRQCTNDLTRLAPDSPVITVLTSATAKILDLLTVFLEEGPADTLGMLSLPGRAGPTSQFLKSRIFFMDKVTVEDVSDQYCQFEIAGPQARTLLESSGLASSQSLQVSDLEGIACMVFRRPEPPGNFIQLVAAAPATRHIQERLDQAGIGLVNDEAFEVLRIEAGLPAVDAELIDRYTPLETNLDGYISDNKGCYTGQEIIARQITYDKVTRRLAGLRTQTAVEPGSPVIAEGKNIGEITSAAVSPQFGFISLAVLKRPYFEVGSQVMVQGNQESLPASVVSLPFTSSEE